MPFGQPAPRTSLTLVYINLGGGGYFLWPLRAGGRHRRAVAAGTGYGAQTINFSIQVREAEIQIALTATHIYNSRLQRTFPMRTTFDRAEPEGL